MKFRFVWLALGLTAFCCGLAQAEAGTVIFARSELAGIGAEAGVMRRDPSDVIKVGDLFYVWYSKGEIVPGYDATVWYATSPDGHTWTEKGRALATGKPGSWEGASVFTPNILVAEGRYWLFYTGTSRAYTKPFNPDSKIGIAVSDSPDGPWERLATNPVLRNSDRQEDFDSHLVDDACLLVRDGKCWLYYKGRQLGKSPAQTKMGLAIADHPQGSYIKHETNPVIPGNHEVLVWPQGTGVAAMIGTTGPSDITNTIQYAEDGIHFSKTHDVKNGPAAGGAYRPEAFTQGSTGDIPEWGVEIGNVKGHLPFIRRFDLAEIKPDDSGGIDVTRQPALKSNETVESRPNLVVIFTDDQGYADLGCFGGNHVSTPRLDRMAAEGLRLTSFYVGGPLCTPSRAALMTGCYPKRINMAVGSNRFPVLLAADSKGLHPEEITIAEVLKKAGYRTGMFGKWHLGDQPEFLPTRQGFEAFFGLPYSHDIHPFHTQQQKYNFPSLPLLEGETVVALDPDADYLTKRFTERSVAFIEENKDRPFFLYLAHPIPHRPLHASPPFMDDVPDAVKAALEKEGDGVDYETRDQLYKQAISEIDWSVGRILDTLEAQGLDDKTLVFFTSDNGPRIGKATPLKGGKGSVFEGGPRVPAVVRWPGHILAGHVCDELLTVMDLLPTFANFAGAEIPSDRAIDGSDIGPVLTENTASPHDAVFYFEIDRLAAVRSGKWKLHLKKARGNDGVPNGTGGEESGLIPSALYDLQANVGEAENVMADNSETVARLLSIATAFEKDVAQNNRPAGFAAHPKPLSK